MQDDALNVEQSTTPTHHVLKETLDAQRHTSCAQRDTGCSKPWSVEQSRAPTHLEHAGVERRAIKHQPKSRRMHSNQTNKHSFHRIFEKWPLAQGNDDFGFYDFEL